MNKLFSAAALLSAALLIAGCRIASLEPEFPEGSDSSVKFTLTAAYGDPDSKAAFDEDGLNMSWTPGDVLYLIDPSETNPTVTLSSDITEAAKTAVFHTTEVVPAGEYIVVYGQNSLDVMTDIHMKAISEPDQMAQLAGNVRLYGSLTVEQDQTSAEITLKQLYAMLTFKFENVPSGDNLRNMGIAVSDKGLKNLILGRITKDGLETAYSGTFMTDFTWAGGKDSKSLIAPVDLSGKKVFFFVLGENEEQLHVNYEFEKSGINLQEGNNYNITLDFSKATVSTINRTEQNAKILTSAADFRAAAYWSSGLTFYLENDIDFDNEVVFPIRAAALIGNGHTLSNVNIDLAECANVGILSYDGHVHDLNVASSSFTGYDNVGSMVGNGYCENCTCTSVTVTGGQYVGGLVGRANSAVKNCSLLGQSKVNGSRNYVGGIVGYSGSSRVDHCLVKGTVQVHGEGEFTGGIAGRADGGVSACGVEATVEGTRYYIGGVVGWGSCSNSYCYGDVSGAQHIGGITGSTDEDGSCAECYHIGSVTGDNGVNSVGGISGSASKSKIDHCYSCGTVSSGYGMCYLLDAECAGTNLTSEARFSSDVESAENSNCGPGKTFLSKLSVLQGSENSYVEACWPGLNIGGGDPRCPLLAWQYEFEDAVSIPGFNDLTW